MRFRSIQGLNNNKDYRSLRLIQFESQGPAPIPLISVRYLIIGGGGGAGGLVEFNIGASGGGSSGDVVTGYTTVDPAITYNINIGLGGAGGFGYARGGNGLSSQFEGADNIISAQGGGGGGSSAPILHFCEDSCYSGNNNGGGGGSSGIGGIRGGSGYFDSKNSVSRYAGGGAGADSAGGNGDLLTGGGAGGDGTYSDITGESIAYAGGGGGGGRGCGCGGLGGVGGGGNGSVVTTEDDSSPGQSAVHYGSGGGGSQGGLMGENEEGSSGFQGVVYLSYEINGRSPPIITGEGNTDISSATPGKYTYKFTGIGTITF